MVAVSVGSSHQDINPIGELLTQYTDISSEILCYLTPINFLGASRISKNINSLCRDNSPGLTSAIGSVKKSIELDSHSVFRNALKDKNSAVEGLVRSFVFNLPKNMRKRSQIVMMLKEYLAVGKIDESLNLMQLLPEGKTKCALLRDIEQSKKSKIE